MTVIPITTLFNWVAVAGSGGSRMPYITSVNIPADSDTVYAVWRNPTPMTAQNIHIIASVNSDS